MIRGLRRLPYGPESWRFKRQLIRIGLHITYARWIVGKWHWIEGRCTKYCDHEEIF